jgi:hypothetical protein
MHFVEGHLCCPNFLAQPIRKEEKFGPTSKLAIYEQKCKLCTRTNRQISLALLQWRHVCREKDREKEREREREKKREK